MSARKAIWIFLVVPSLSIMPVLADETRGGAVVIRNTAHDLSRPLRDVPPHPAGNDEEEELVPLSAETSSSVPSLPDPVMQSSPGPLVSTTDLMNFDGLTSSAGPPDTNGAAGATQYMQWVNSKFGIFDKQTGTLIYGPAAGSTLFAGMGCPCESDHGDGIILYDKAAGRWLVSQLANPGTCGRPLASTNVCIAISTTSDATGTWYRYQFDMQNIAPDPWPEDTIVPDYPKFGVWPDGYYYASSIDAYDSSHTRTGLCSFDRANMLDGNDATAQCFLVQMGPVGANYLPADLDGATPPPCGSPNPFVDINNSGQELRLVRFHVDWNNADNSTLTGPIHLPVASFTRASGTVPQLGVTQELDTLGDRVMFRLAYRNFGDHESLVANHSVQNPTTALKGVRWYEVQDPNGLSPFVAQQGTFMPDSTHRWMGSIAMDQAGDIAVGYSASSSEIHPAIRYTGRTPSDPLGTMQDENSIIEGTGSQTASRWGDYSSMTIDPVDDCTFWYTSEYLEADGGLKHTRIASFKFPSCGSGDSNDDDRGRDRHGHDRNGDERRRDHEGHRDDEW